MSALTFNTPIKSSIMSLFSQGACNYTYESYHKDVTASDVTGSGKGGSRSHPAHEIW